MEVFHVKTSIFLIQEPKDSILEKKYEELNLLTETSNYVESLQKAFYLDEEASDSKNLFLKFKIKSLFAKIYRKNNDHIKAIANYKKSLKLLNDFLFEDDGIVLLNKNT